MKQRRNPLLPLSLPQRQHWIPINKRRWRVSGRLNATMQPLLPVLCTWRLTASMLNDAGGVIYVKLTVKIVNYAVNCQSLVTVTPLFTIVIYGAIFEWRRMCTTLIATHYVAKYCQSLPLLLIVPPIKPMLTLLFTSLPRTLAPS